MMRPRSRYDAGIESDSVRPKFRTVKIPYEFEKWISNFCAGQRADSGISPLEFAERVFEAARETLQGVKIVAESGSWRDDNPGDPIVVYVVAGFTQDFTEFGIYQSEIKLNPEGNGLTYVPPLRHASEIHRTGQTEYIERVLAEEEPWLGFSEILRKKHVPDVEALFPSAQPKAKEAIVRAVSLVRVQHEFAKETVGNPVSIALVDKISGLATLGSM